MPVLSLGSPAVVFNRATGGSGDTFNLPAESRRYGQLILQAIGFIGAGAGTITALTVDLEISMDGGTTWAKLVVGLVLTTLAQSVAVSGAGGLLCRLTSTTFTLGTATSIQINASAG